MDVNFVKTLNWSDCKVGVTALAKAYWMPSEVRKVKNFTEFIQSYSKVSSKEMVAFLQDFSDKFHCVDDTSCAQNLENSCLFSCEPASALEIIVRYLEILNTGGKVPALWCFLDEEKKAVVHFVNNGGWYAEAFFDCHEAFSAVHLVKSKENTLLIPVVFTDNLVPYASFVEERDCFLQKYLPHTLFDFLSKKSSLRGSQSSNTSDSCSYPRRDNEDLL